MISHLITMTWEGMNLPESHFLLALLLGEFWPQKVQVGPVLLELIT